MKKEDLLTLGLTEEQALKVLEANGRSISLLKAKYSDYEELKAKLEEAEKAKEDSLSNEEKLAKALEEAEKQKSAYLKATAKLEAEKILVAQGLSEEDYKDLIDLFVTEDSEATKVNATKIASLISSKVTAKENEIKSQQLQDMKPGGSDGKPSEDAETAFVKGLFEGESASTDLSAFTYGG